MTFDEETWKFTVNGSEKRWATLRVGQTMKQMKLHPKHYSSTPQTGHERQQVVFKRGSGESKTPCSWPAPNGRTRRAAREKQAPADRADAMLHSKQRSMTLKTAQHDILLFSARSKLTIGKHHSSGVKHDKYCNVNTPCALTGLIPR